MKKPLVVSVAGVEGTGVTVACNRVAYCLNKLGINTVTAKLGNPKATERWEDNFILGKYKGVDVVILIRHGFTHSAVKQRLTTAKCRFQPDSVRPNFAVLMTCDDDTYGFRNNINVRQVLHGEAANQLARLKLYRSLEWPHWGTKRVYALDTGGEHGRLKAAGSIKRLIMQELEYAKNSIA